MSILIKGMRMPENCIKCPMQFGGMCYVMPAEVDKSRVAPTVEEALKQGKPDWCPLVEIPEPHGNLIDYDEVKSNMIPLSFSVQKWISEVGLAYCKTIIEAEGSENHDD